jgi:putative molybdopterin biosynthesis protein
MTKTNTIQSLDALKILGDARRVAILRTLMAREATISQLGRLMEMHPAKIRYHLKQLESAGLVEFAFSRETYGFLEKFYRATAQAFFINHVLLPEPGKQGTVFALGSHDPALELLSRHLAGPRTPNLVAIPVGSLDGLIALRQGFCQLTACHLYDPADGEYNLPYVRHLFPGQAMRVVTLVNREQGLIVAPGNPKGIRGLEDLTRSDLTFVNRKTGSGTRLWLDYQLGQQGIKPAQIRGYTTEVSTHREVAEAVRQGRADLGLAVYAAARAANLDFIPLLEERFDLVIPEEHYRNPLLAPALETINSAAFRREVAALGGYDTSHTGESQAVES